MSRLMVTHIGAGDLQEPDECEHCLHTTKHTSGQEGSVGTRDTEALEDSWAVVVNGVDTRAVLPEEEHGAEEEAPLDLGLLERGEGLEEAGANVPAVPVKVLVDVADLLDNVDVTGAEVPDPAEVRHALLALTLHEQPAGGLLDPDGAEQEQAAGDELDGEGDQPLGVVGREGCVDSVVDPEADKASDLPPELVNTDQSATDGRRRQFRDENGHHVAGSTDTDTGEDTAGQDQAEATVSIGAEHEAGTEVENEGEDEEGLAAAEEVRGDIGEQGTEEGAGLVDRDDVGLDQRQALVAV